MESSSSRSRKRNISSTSELPSSSLPSTPLMGRNGKREEGSGWKGAAVAALLGCGLLTIIILNQYAHLFRGGSAEDLKEVIRRQNNIIRRLSLNVGLDASPVQFIERDDQGAAAASNNGKHANSGANKPQQSQQQESSPEVEEGVTPTQLMSVLPEGSVWCTGTSKDDRTCRFKNLCYNPVYSDWFIAKTNSSIQEGIITLTFHGMNFLADTSSFSLLLSNCRNYIEVDPLQQNLQNIQVRYEETPHLLFKRLHPDNIMHNLHDDVLNLYFQIKKYITKPSEPGIMKLPFSLYSQRLLMLDEYEGTGSTRPFQYLSNHPIRFSSYLTLKSTSTDITCFRDAFLGNSKITRWYQYGFYDEPQGPISPLPNGMHVREVANWFVKRNGIPLGNDELYPPEKVELSPEQQEKLKASGGSDNSHLDFPETNLIVIMARRRNRLILNEEELASSLTSAFGLETVFLRNEDMTFEEQIHVMRKARIVIAMHGSVLVMAMFCRRGTVLVEMYPYAVPGNHYTPYKTMAHLPGVDLVYRPWENTHADANVGHPDRHELAGGINHLPEEERRKVLTTLTVPRHKCCSSPYWLYRIYQDTEVNVGEINQLIKDALQESRTRVLPDLYAEKRNNPVLYSPIHVFECISLNATTAASLSIDFASVIKGSMLISWKHPWNGASAQHFEVLLNNDGSILKSKSNETSVIIHGFESDTRIVFFVRPIAFDGSIGEWGAAGTCVIP